MQSLRERLSINGNDEGRLISEVIFDEELIKRTITDLRKGQVVMIYSDGLTINSDLVGCTFASSSLSVKGGNVVLKDYKTTVESSQIYDVVYLENIGNTSRGGRKVSHFTFKNSSGVADVFTHYDTTCAFLDATKILKEKRLKLVERETLNV